MPKISQEFGQIFKSDDKTWHVDNWRFFRKITNLARSYQRCDKRDDKKGHLDKWGL